MMCRAEPADANLRVITFFIICLEEQWEGNVGALF
jgi:protein involved in temperature-dependent protein secretion